MTQPAESADVAPDLKSSEVNAPEGEHHHFRARYRRLEAAAEALKRVRDQLRARASWDQSCDHDRKHDRCEDNCPDPDGGRP